MLSLKIDMTDACSPPGQPICGLQNLLPPLVLQKGTLHLCPVYFPPKVGATRILENLIPLMAYFMSLQLCCKANGTSSGKLVIVRDSRRLLPGSDMGAIKSERRLGCC